MAALNLTAEFLLFPDNTQMGQNFSLSGYVFDDLSGTGSLFVNQTGNEKGLQFIPEGVEITLPSPTSSVDLRLGAFSGPVDIVAKDSLGNVVRTQTLNILNQYVDVRILRPEIASILLTQGGREGILIKIGATYCTN
jgi:hypothetical protein